MSILVVGSKSGHKTAAVAKALLQFEKIDGSPVREVRGVAAESGVPPQPFGLAETTTGAMNRAKGALAQVADAQFAAGIESGLMRMAPHTFVDVAVVVLLERGDAQPVVTTSTGFPCPARFVEASLAAGCQKTAGEFFAEATGCDATDWHAYMTAGMPLRRGLLVQAVFAAFVLKFKR
jgi:inosine/xanthosine triphosphatase